MTNIELANKLIEIATKYKTLYIMGCFGQFMDDCGKNRYTKNHRYNKQASRTKMIMNATDDTAGFDCVCLIKGVLWGWTGDKNALYGGAKYASNGVPDIGADCIIKKCSNVSTDFSNIEIGELVHMKGHVGVYIGDGLAVECTPKWKNGVQLTACNCSKSGYNRRDWTSHGKLPYVTYVESIPQNPVEVKKTVDELARECIRGLWGDGQERKDRLTAASYDYRAVQNKVNEMLKPKPAKKTNEELARECIRGLWGNGSTRRQKLQAAGHNYSEVQAIVNKLMRG